MLICCLCQSYQSFNSTMVRLKVLRSRADAPSADLFQFHNGSIKSFNLTPHPITIDEFQFHNGSIKSLDRHIPFRSANATCFNSTMVRLKVPALITHTDASISFNSTMDRLKGDPSLIKEDDSMGFNSTMVRLKDELDISEMDLHARFNSTMVRLKVMFRLRI